MDMRKCPTAGLSNWVSQVLRPQRARSHGVAVHRHHVVRRSVGRLLRQPCKAQPARLRWLTSRGGMSPL
jgi:hypothetical protein